jgi:hypothetical protein
MNVSLFSSEVLVDKPSGSYHTDTTGVVRTSVACEKPIDAIRAIVAKDFIFVVVIILIYSIMSLI